MFKVFCRAFAVIAAVGLMAALPARAAIQFEPGLWQETESGTENGQAAKPKTNTDCMTPEDAEDPVKSFTNLKDQADGQCKTVNVKQSGNTVYVVMSCGFGNQMSMDLQMAYTFIDSRHYTGKIRTAVAYGGRKMTSDKTVEAKWIGATCQKK